MDEKNLVIDCCVVGRRRSLANNQLQPITILRNSYGVKLAKLQRVSSPPLTYKRKPLGQLV